VLISALFARANVWSQSQPQTQSGRKRDRKRKETQMTNPGEKQNHFADQWTAIDAMLEYGASVSIDERAHTMIDRGYAAFVDNVTLHLRRVGVHYEWHFDVKLHVEGMSFDEVEAAGLDGTLRS
jgi:hypothetical protein